MAGIYLHIPFCRHKCNYCNFYSLASTRHLAGITHALVCELEQQKNYLGGQKIETIYFGGGTPSLLAVEDIETILNAVNTNFQVEPGAEITLEANPDDLTPGKLIALKAAGVNRLSIGIQSFRQEDLDFLSRTHSAARLTQCINDARHAGFYNLSIDLIYGIPTLSDQGWIENLEKTFSFEIPHISAYSLTIEDKTSLEFMIRKGKMKPVDENMSLSQYHILCRMMKDNGYDHYEISNFCRPGAYSRHNTAYWQGTHYLGIGPSAHSYNGMSRQWNIANISKYMETTASGKVAFELEILSPATQLNEYIMTSLRTMWGCDLVHVKQKSGAENAEKLLLGALPYIEENKMVYQNGKLILTPEGRLFADGISAALFSDGE
jgi:putative oxygen-independent coproporphyrinogen III oxidase